MDKTEPRKEEEKCSSNTKYDIVFVGGGPSTLSFISYLFQNNFANKFFSNLKVLILEKTTKFGSGCLGGYGINTNTPAQGFSRLICNPNTFSVNYKDKEATATSDIYEKGKHKTHSVEKDVSIEGEIHFSENEDPDNDSENGVFDPLSGFEEIFLSGPTQTLIKMGVKCAPLTLVGYYLDCVGNYYSHMISTLYGQDILRSRVTVQSISMTKSDDFELKVKEIDTNEEYRLKAKHVVLATGGLPKPPKNLQVIQSLLASPADFYYSNDILQEHGYAKLMSNLKAKEKEEENKKKKIVIIGGSHSGFSSAWILINNPSSYKLISSEYSPKLKQECSKCKEEDGRLRSCVCFGEVFNKLWTLNIKEYLSFEYEITILHRENIRVFFKTENEALKEGYNLYSKEDVNQNGKIFPFIGLRADAKSLYLNIVKGEEKRVKLVKATTFEEQAVYIKSSDATIWACGYETEDIPTYDFRDKQVSFNKGLDGLYEIDFKQRLMNQNKMPLKNFFGIGQGYSTHSHEVINGIKARGDSVHLYNTITSRRLYKALSDYVLQKVYEVNRKKSVDKRSSYDKKKSDAKSKTKDDEMMIEASEHEKTISVVENSSASENIGGKSTIYTSSHLQVQAEIKPEASLDNVVD